MLSFSVPRREIDVMIPESCDIDSAVNGFIMLYICVETLIMHPPKKKAKGVS